MKNFLLTLFGFVVLASACQKLEDNLLAGEWKAAQVLEEGKPMDVDLDKIHLSLDGDNNYNFSGTLNYREAGTYYMQSNLLYTLDTINQASTEKAVEVVKLTPDSLYLKMREEGKERLLKLYRLTGN